MTISERISHRRSQDQESRQTELDTREEVARLAYEKWQMRGCPAGTELEDWLEAEREVSERELSAI